MLTLDMLRKLWPHGNDKIPGLIEGIVATSQWVFPKYGINSDLLIAHLMAQISHECGAGLDVVENLNYSAVRMTQVWPSRFPTVNDAAPYAHDPQALANKVYNGRMGNTIGSNDGWTYRGRGATQTTGKEGYSRLATKVGLPLLSNPDLVNSPGSFLECGVADFILCGCMPYAKNDDILGVTKRLNGGIIGLDQRKDWLFKWKRELAQSRAYVPLSPTPTLTPSSSSIAQPRGASVPSPTKPAQPPVVETPKISENVFTKFFTVLAALFKGKKS